jgi:hypothetical protein
LDRLVADWYVDRQQAERDPQMPSSSMTAAHHDERRALVARARAMLRADGTLHGPELVVAGVAFCAGDEVIVKVADRRLRPKNGSRDSYIRNGTRGTVLSVGHDYLTVDFEHRGPVTVPRSYLEQKVAPGVHGVLLHSYCLTTFAAQGATFATTRHLGTDHSSGAEIYVGLTRGRHGVALYALRRADLVPPVLDDDLPRLVDETDAARALANSAASSRTERLAREIDPLATEAARLADRDTVSGLVTMRGGDAPNETLAERAETVAVHRLGARALSEPPEVVGRVLGPRPVETETDEPSLAEHWERVVGAVVSYRADYKPRRFPSGPTEELIGLRELSSDPECWDHVDRAIEGFLVNRPELLSTTARALAMTVDIER